MKETIDLYDDEIGKVQYIGHYGNDKMIVNAARVSFGRDADTPLNDKDKKLIKYLLKNRHTSPFEHCGITFKFTVPLFVRGQHHRHRTWAYNEISRRYTSENIQFYCPKTFRSQHDKNKQASNEDEIDPVVKTYVATTGFYDTTASQELEVHVDNSLELYNSMLKAGVAREQARMVLPQNMYTEYYGTVNLHNAMHFLTLRLDKHSQWEIRRVAEAMQDIMDELFPTAMEAYRDLRQ